MLFIGPGILEAQSRGNLQVVGYELGKFVLTEGEAKNLHFSPIPAEELLRRAFVR